MENQSWEDANKWEHEWHGDCIQPEFNEVSKQYTYANLMGLDKYATYYYGMRGWDFGEKKVLDMGCGPYSMLLRSKAALKVGVDPCEYPLWVRERYKEADVHVVKEKGEDFNHFGAYDVLNNINFASSQFGYFDKDKSAILDTHNFDIALLYNCLQHTEDPEKIIQNIRKVSKEIHVFEWENAGISPGHIQNLTEENMDKWLGGSGRCVNLDRGNVVGRAYVGIFKGDLYDK